MFLKPPVPGSKPGKKHTAKKRKSPEELKESDQEYEEKKRERKFQPHWRERWKWLGYNDAKNEVFCELCRSMPTYADKYSPLYKGQIAERSTGFDPHEKSSSHLICVKRKKAESETPAVLAGVHVNCDMDAGFQEQMQNMFHTAYYVVKKEKPYTDFPDLVQLNSRTGSDMPNCYKSDRACARFTIDIYNVERQQLLSDLKNTHYISVLIDGATDSGVLENEIVYVKYFTEERGLVQSFLGIEDVKHAHADGVLSAVQSVFEKAGLGNWKEKVVFFCADGAAVNMGKNNGVAAKLKKDVGHLLSIHCVAHRLELSMVDSIKAQPRLKKLQEVLHFIYMQYHYSPKALRELRMLADALEDKVLKPTNLKGARWLPYIYKATQILCNGYAVFVAHFEDQVSPERTPRPSPAVVGRAKSILQYLKSFDQLQFMHFLLDTLDFLKTMSLQFQLDNLTPGEAVEYIEACLNGLTELCLEPGEQHRNMLAEAVTGIYKGVELTNTSADNTLAPERKRITEVLTKQIESRMEDLLSGSIVAKFSAIDHHTWPKLDDSNKEAFVLHGREDMKSLCHHYATILEREGTTATQVMTEYRLYKTWARTRTAPLRDTLLLMLQRADLQQKYKSLNIFAQIYLTMAISSAVCERGFSCMKRVKSDWRSRLTTPSLTRLMFLTIEGPPLDTFNAQRAVLGWWQSGPRARRPGYTVWEGRKNQPTEEELEEELVMLIDD